MTRAEEIERAARDLLRLLDIKHGRGGWLKPTTEIDHSRERLYAALDRPRGEERGDATSIRALDAGASS